MGILFLSILCLSLSSKLESANIGDDIVLGSAACDFCKKFIDEDTVAVLNKTGYEDFFKHIEKKCYHSCNYLIDPFSITVCDWACHQIIVKAKSTSEEEIKKIVSGSACVVFGLCPHEHGKAHLTHIKLAPYTVASGENIEVTLEFTTKKVITDITFKYRIITPDYYVIDSYIGVNYVLDHGAWIYKHDVSTLPPDSMDIPMLDGYYNLEASACEGIGCFSTDDTVILFKGHHQFYLYNYSQKS